MLVAAQPPAIRVTVNDRNLAVASIEERGRVLVPMRAIFEALGARVSYDSGSQTIDAHSDAHTVRLTLGSKHATVDAREVALDVPPRVVANRTYVPLRFVGTALGAVVGYDAGARLVSVALPLYQANSGSLPTVTYEERPTPSPPAVVYGGTIVDSYPYANDMRLTVNGRWFAPGSPISVELTAPPGGQAFAFMCTSDWRYEMSGAPQSPFYYATLYAPRYERVDSCPITAMYVAWNGAVTYAPYPIFVHFSTPNTLPPYIVQPTPTPAPEPAATPQPRTIPHEPRRTAPLEKARPDVKPTPI